MTQCLSEVRRQHKKVQLRVSTVAPTAFRAAAQPIPGTDEPPSEEGIEGPVASSVTGASETPATESNQHTMRSASTSWCFDRQQHQHLCLRVAHQRHQHHQHLLQAQLQGQPHLFIRFTHKHVFVSTVNNPSINSLLAILRGCSRSSKRYVRAHLISNESFLTTSPPTLVTCTCDMVYYLHLGSG